MAHRETSSQSSHAHDALLQRFGATVRQYRTQRGLTQRALAGRMDVHPRYMSKIERGDNNIGVLLLFRLAHALDLPAACLLAPLETWKTVRAPATWDAASSGRRAPPRDEPSRLLQRLGTTIRQARQAQRLVQPALAAKTGLSFGYISEIELGQRNLSVVSLVRIAEALGVSVAQLLAPVET